MRESIKLYNLRKGALSIEFLFAILFILFCFIAILTIQFTVFYRSLATYELIRIARVEGIFNKSAYSKEIKLDEETSNIKKEIKQKIIDGWRKDKIVYIGSLVETIFSNTGMNLKKDINENSSNTIENQNNQDQKNNISISPFSKYILEYNAFLFKKFNIPSQTFYWIEPIKPYEEE